MPRAAARTLVLILFALPLSALWKSGRSDGSKIGGLLPFSDADHYYHCASILAEGQGFSALPEGAFCSRRPLFASALGGLFAATGHDLRMALALLVLINAVACLLAAGELRAAHGAVAATVFVVTLFLFYRPLAGATLTEQLGLPLGAVGFAALWRSGRRDEPRMAIFGLFLLTFALIARAGAFLALPCILVWCAAGGGRPARASLRRFGLGGGAVALAFLLNAALVRTIGVPGSSFSNFSYTLYGVVFEGDWKLASKEHPELAPLGEEERSRRILALALDEARAQPLRLARGCLRAWRGSLGGSYFFRYALDERVKLLLGVLTVAGLARCLVKRHDRLCSLLLAACLGVVASIPFMPPWDGDVRVHAATVPFLAALPAVAAGFLAERLGGHTPGAAPDEGGSSARATVLFGGGLVSLALLPSLLTILLRDPLRFTGDAVAGCHDPIYVRAPRGSSISVVPNDLAGPRYPIELRQRNFRRGLEPFISDYAGLGGELAAVRAPFLVFDPLTLQPVGHAVVVVGAPLLAGLPLESPFWRVCTEPAKDSMARAYGLRHATSVQAASPLAADRR
jgi:hypothetical protein